MKTIVSVVAVAALVVAVGGGVVVIEDVAAVLGVVAAEPALGHGPVEHDVVDPHAIVAHHFQPGQAGEQRRIYAGVCIGKHRFDGAQVGSGVVELRPRHPFTVRRVEGVQKVR